LDTLSGRALTDALKAYVRRARRGVLDAALITGTGKDLVEAVAAHILVQRFGTYSTSDNFPTLVGQAFVATGPCAVRQQQPTPQEQMDLALYDLACAVNRLRNRQRNRSRPSIRYQRYAFASARRSTGDGFGRSTVARRIGIASKAPFFSGPGSERTSSIGLSTG
jgi:hypothetical protein